MVLDLFFIWLGYDSLLQWIAESLISNLFWIVLLTPLAVLLWITVEEMWGKRIIKGVRRYKRWIKRYKKPGIPSDHDLLVLERRKNRRLRDKNRILQNLITEEKGNQS